MIFVQMPGRWLTEDRRADIYPREIISIISSYYGVTVSEILSKNRKRKIVFPRNVAYYFIRKYTGEHLRHIGSLFSGRDHTVVHAGIDQVKDFLKFYPEIIDDIGNVERQIKRVIDRRN